MTKTCTIVSGNALQVQAKLRVRCGDDSFELNASALGQPQGPRLEPGVVTTVRGADLVLLLVGFALVAPTLFLMAARWYLLLRSRAFSVTYRRCFSLTMVGYFSNFVLPGTVSGDLIRAFYAAQGTHRKADAATSVLVDRIVGLLALVILACVTSLFLLDTSLGMLLAIACWIAAIASLIAIAAYATRSTQRLGHGRLHVLLGKVDLAILAYKDAPIVLLGALVLSLATHVFLCAATALAGGALGMDLNWSLLLTVLPILYLVAAVPVSYQGFGPMEAVGYLLLVNPPAVTMNQLVGMLLLSRVYRFGYSLLGVWPLVRGRFRLEADLQAEPTAAA